MSNQQDHTRPYDHANGTSSPFQLPPPMITTTANHTMPIANHAGANRYTTTSQHVLAPRPTRTSDFHPESAHDLASRACADSFQDIAPIDVGNWSRGGMGDLVEHFNWTSQEGYSLPWNGDMPNVPTGPYYRSYNYDMQQLPSNNASEVELRPWSMCEPSQMISPAFHGASYGSTTTINHPYLAAPRSASGYPRNV